MRDALTSVLDFLGLLTIAVGLGVLLSTWLGLGAGFIAAGAVLMAGSAIATLLARPPRSEG